MKLTLLSPRPERNREAEAGVDAGAEEATGSSRGRAWTTDGSSKARRRRRQTSTSSPTHAFGGDNGAPNGTSIALLAEFGGARALLTADAHAPVARRVDPQAPGQDADTPDKLQGGRLQGVPPREPEQRQLGADSGCSTAGTTSSRPTATTSAHPDRQAIARILKYGGTRPSLYFNYRTRYNEVWAREDLQEKYAYAAHYPPADPPGIVVPVLRR